LHIRKRITVDEQKVAKADRLARMEGIGMKPSESEEPETGERAFGT
jgi:hypothetical protein